MSETSSGKQTAMRRLPRFRFSLLNLATLMTMAALGLGLIASAQRNHSLVVRNNQLAADNLQMRDELGIFEVDDPTKIHAIGVPTEDGEPCQYRVYLPPGKKYQFNYKANDIPEVELPGRYTLDSIAPGNYLISVNLKRNQDPKTGKPLPYATAEMKVVPTGLLSYSTSSYSIVINESKNDWILNKVTGSMTYSWGGIGDQVKLVDHNQAVVLYRARAHETQGTRNSYSTKPAKGPCDGFMVWIETLPAPSSSGGASGGGSGRNETPTKTGENK